MMTANNSNKFNFFIPATFEKSGELGEMKIKGVCSSIVEDSDGEYLDPSGFDYAPLLEKGFFNWNHQANKEAGAIIGRPTSAKVINNGTEFYVEGSLYKGLKQARDVYDLAQVLESEDPTRRLGFSIEGQAIERDPINPKRIKKARITGVAITHCPKNPNTLLSIMKGEYQEPFVDDEEEKEEDTTEKAMSVNVDLNPPSVETKERVTLTKSETYNRIFTRYESVGIEKADQVYELIKQTSLKLFNMDAIITEESLKKAFEILDSSIIKSEEDKKPEDYDKKDELIKNEDEGKEKDKEKEEPEGDSDDEVKKAAEVAELAKSLLDSGLNKGEVVDKMIEKGYSMDMCQGVVEKVIREMSANKDGGKMEGFDAIGKSLSEAIFSRLEKSEASMNTNFRALVEGIDTKFGALSEILKKSDADSTAIGGIIDEIKKSQEGMIERLKNVEETPIPGKAAVSTKAFERFAKAEDTEALDANTYSLSKAEDREALTGRLFAEFEKSAATGRPNQRLERAIMDIEISKAISASEIPVLQSFGIKVIQ